jgi:hypothetical protein
LSAPELGNFNLQNNQTAPRNVFLNAEWLNNQLGLDAKANVVLLDGNSTSGEINKMLQTCWSTDDANLRIRENQDLNYTEVVSDRVFIEPELEKYVLSSFSGSWPVMSYFANEFRFGDQACPYSFVSTDTLLSGNQMVVNQWLADDLKVNVGDSVRVSYFEVGPLRRLKQRDTVFVVQRIEPIKGLYADQNLMPDIPGLSDAGHCSDWKQACLSTCRRSVRPTKLTGTTTKAPRKRLYRWRLRKSYGATVSDRQRPFGFRACVARIIRKTDGFDESGNGRFSGDRCSSKRLRRGFAQCRFWPAFHRAELFCVVCCRFAQFPVVQTFFELPAG